MKPWRNLITIHNVLTGTNAMWKHKEWSLEAVILFSYAQNMRRTNFGVDHLNVKGYF